MVKNERSSTGLLKRTILVAPPVPSLPPPPPVPPVVLQPVTIMTQRLSDPHAIDITSRKGQFAWEKIAQSDTYAPVIFRGDTKYFCVRMLRKLMPEFPDDIIRRASYYQYRIPIELHSVTLYEVELLNKINAQHSHWAYSRQPFNSLDELVRVSDFLPFYEHLIRMYIKPTYAARAATLNAQRPLLPSPLPQNVQRPASFAPSVPGVRGRPAVPRGPPAQVYSYQTTEHQPNNSATVSSTSTPRLAPVVPSVPSATRPSGPPKQSTPSHPVLPRPQLQPIAPQPTVMSSSNTNSTNTVSINNASIVPSVTQITTTMPSRLPITPAATIQSSSSSPSVVTSSNTVSSTSTTTSQKTPTKQQQSSALLSSTSSASSSLSSILSQPKSPRLHCGWLQINKLYTPYVSSSASNHQLYKIPVSLLTFYDLLKFPTDNTNAAETAADSSNDQTVVTPQEIELINELCTKQGIKAFSIDTKLIKLASFYRVCSANMLFVKELPMEEPKASICKDWPSVVQINGGIYRLRHMTTLKEQTVPFVGKYLLKTFSLSSERLTSASIIKPTPTEQEFLTLILFFSNISVSSRNIQLIDLESVQKEYNVDLILPFNDKFPTNVLDYQQQQGARPSTSQAQIIPPSSTSPTNTIAESTPPPSPPSPPNNPQSKQQQQQQQPTEVTMNSSTLLAQSSVPSSSSSSSPNRFHKMITFHGEQLVAYVCSGLGSLPSSQRECISVRSLCNLLYPNSPSLDKLETKMLRLLRLKSINRYRPQNQQSLGFTRLIDIKDAETHWDYIEQGMRTTSGDDEGAQSASNVVNVSLPSKSAETSTNNSALENLIETFERNNIDNQAMDISDAPPPMVNKSPSTINRGAKRQLEESVNNELDEEDIPVLERVNKRVRFSEKDEEDSTTSMVARASSESLSDKVEDDDDDTIQRRKLPSYERDDDEFKTRSGRFIDGSPVKTRRRSQGQKLDNKKEHRWSTRSSSKSSVSQQTRNSSSSSPNKTIDVKRPTPRTRVKKQSKASWVEKYGIDECCVRLNFYDPIYET